MNCENCFCVYEKKGKCTLDEITIDVSGACSECIYIDLDKKELQKAKQDIIDRWK